MNSIEVPLVRERPACLSDVGGKGAIVECADYYINLLISHAPAQLTVEYSQDPKTVNWTLSALHEKKIIYSETMCSSWYRQILARIGCTYLEGNFYGGFSRMYLISSGRVFSAAFYLGNDSQCGFWFKGRCAPVTAPETPDSENFKQDD